jgi:hypothetical protein
MIANYRLWATPAHVKSLPVPAKLPETKKAHLVLLLAGFQLAIALARLYTLPAVIGSGVNLLEFSGAQSGPAGVVVFAGLVQPLIAAMVLILASMAVRRAWRIGSWLALLVGAFNVAALLNVGNTIPLWSALAVLSAAQGCQLLWLFGRKRAQSALQE